MAGHSKWANIQHRKNKQDAKRGKLFTKLIRAITVAARMGGGDPAGNPRLRDAIAKGKVANMSNDIIDKAIKKGSGALDGSQMEEVNYEGYGPGGVAIIVECLTDNRNRTVAEVRHAFNKCGGNLGTDGSVAYLFTKQGLLSFPPGLDEEQVLTVALEVGASDVVTNDDSSIDVLTDPQDFTTVREGMAAKKLEPANAEVALLPAIYINLDKEVAEKVMQLQEMLEDLDDVQNVYSNAEFPEEMLN